MNLEPRSCWRCGRQTTCLVETCPACRSPVIVTCPVCVEETASAVLEWQEARHRRICKVLEPEPELEAPTAPKRRGRPPTKDPCLRTLQHRRQMALQAFHETSIQTLTKRVG